MPPVARRYRSLLEGIDPDEDDFIRFSSADLLHMIVMRGPVADPDIISHFRPDEIGDTDGPFADPSDIPIGNGLKEFVDAWGRPICFKRWPVGFASPLQPVNGLLSSIDQRVSKDGHRLLPLIYSAGPDRQFDLEDYQFNENYSYRNVAYNPFASGVVQGSQPRGDASEVVLFLSRGLQLWRHKPTLLFEGLVTEVLRRRPCLQEQLRLPVLVFKLLPVKDVLTASDRSVHVTTLTIMT